MAIVEKTKQAWDRTLIVVSAFFGAEIVLWAAAFLASWRAEGAGGYWLALPALAAFALAAAGLVLALRSVIRRAEPFWLGVFLLAAEAALTALPVVLYVSGLREVLGR